MELHTLNSNTVRKELDRLLNENEQLKLEQRQILEKVKLLIAKVSHEFKTPLNSVRGFTELIKYQTDNTKINEYSDIILTSSEHMLELIQNIIDVIRAKYKPIKLSYSIFNTKEIIEDIIKTFKTKLTNNGTSKIKHTLIDTMICADYMRFKQLVYNLISNAIKFSYANDNIEIITYIENNLFCFEIYNTGEHIALENRDKIFDFFSQVTDTAQKRSLGSGIGLSLCKSITDAHNGFISVASKKAEYTVFTFKIPLQTNKY